MTIFICGDSTAASYTKEQEPQTGWGQVLNEFLPCCEISNHAMAGRSTKSFIAEGRLLEVEKQLSAGDILLIQFSHNDNYRELVWRRTDVNTAFINCLSIFIDTARLHGARPALLTPIPIRDYEDGALKPSLGEYPDAVRRTAALKNVPLIDVYEKGFNMLEKLGEAETTALYMNVPAGKYPGIPDGRTDNVHTQQAGARLYAQIVAEGLKSVFKEDFQ